VARDKWPNFCFLYAQSTAITVQNLSTVAIFLQKQDTVFLYCPFSSKKKKAKNYFLFFGGKRTVEENDISLLEENGISFLEENTSAQFIN